MVTQVASFQVSQAAPLSGRLIACPIAAVEGWSGLAVAVKSDEVSLALLHADGRVWSSPWRKLATLVELFEGVPLQQAVPSTPVISVCSWTDHRKTDNAVVASLLAGAPAAQSVTPVQALVAWATRMTGRTHLRILIANRSVPSYCVLARDGKPVNSVCLPANGSVFDFYCKVAARQGWQGKEERLQWYSLQAPETPALDLDEGAGHPLLIDADASLAAIEPLAPEQRAAVAQRTLEDRVTQLFTGWFEEDPTQALCLMGDFSYNALLVGAIERAGIPVHVPFASGEHVLAIGAALAAFPSVTTGGEGEDNTFLGPSYSNQQIKDVIDNCRLRAAYLTTSELITQAAESIASNQIVGWFQGPAEIGPRALGARSILASPRMPFLCENLNVFVKNREPFRPFALSIAEECAPGLAKCSANCLWLGSLAKPAPQLAAEFPELVLPNGEMRIHVARQRTNALFHELLNKLAAHIGIAAVANTSFNSPGRPIVATPREAIRTFFSHGIDVLFIGNWMISK
jgi:hypothetical protein